MALTSQLLTRIKDEAVPSMYGEYMYMLERGLHYLQEHILSTDFKTATTVANPRDAALPFDDSECVAYYPPGLVPADTGLVSS